MNHQNNTDQGEFVSPQVLSVSKVHGNTSQEIINITVDKLKLIILSHASSIEQKKSWLAPLGIFITLCITLATTTFQDKGLKADVWEAIFVISAFLTLIWLIYTGYSAYKSISIEDLVEKIKNQK